MSFLYYGLAVVGTATIILAVYNLIIIKRCGCHRRRRRSQSSPSSSSSSPSQPSNRATETAMAATRSCDIRLNRNSSLSSFKYKKESEQDCDCDDSECPVCLSGFEEGEEVRKLPRCKHRFHAPCIDMWLFSHFDCPICRTPVLQFCQLFPPPASSGEEGLLRSAMNGGVAV